MKTKSTYVEGILKPGDWDSRGKASGPDHQAPGSLQSKTAQRSMRSRREPSIPIPKSFPMPISPDDVRPPVCAGRFYPSDPSELEGLVTRLMDAAERTATADSITALLAPHAGYAFSGPTAAVAFKQVSGGSFDTVFVLSPSHYETFQGVSLFPGIAYETPLGTVPIDLKRAEALAAAAPDLIRTDEIGHRQEHGVEVELPFLQMAIKSGWKLLPLVMGSQSARACHHLSDAILATGYGGSTLIVASSDLYHGYSYEACHASDHRTLEAVERLDPDAFLIGLESASYQACGGGPIAVASLLAQKSGGRQAHLLAHTTSADVTGKHDGYVVGYGAAVFGRLSP